jgi:hypothetical protein
MVVVEIGSKNRTIGSQKVDIRERLWVTKRPSMGRPGYTGAGRPASHIPKAEIRAQGQSYAFRYGISSRPRYGVASSAVFSAGRQARAIGRPAN